MQETIHQDVSEIERDARSLAQDLKEAAKRNEVLDKEADFRRKNLRKQHLKLLLLYPDSKEAKDAETHIWMQTSYHFIAAYKQRIASLDRKLFSPGPQNQKDQKKNASRQDRGGGGHVEYRKILARFRQFLAEEEKFYIQLLVRVCMQFSLTQAHPALVKAEILSPGSEEVTQADIGRTDFPEHQDMPPMSNEEHDIRLATFTKLLVCLGDIARYREQYNDGGGRPRAGHEEGLARKVVRGGKRPGHDALARPRNYSRAQTLYEQARLLVPSYGNASHQLAILSSYQKDTFGSLLHYYRALCVRQPYEPASDNLNTILKKSLDQYWAAKQDSKSRAEGGQMVPKLRVDRFKDWVVVLHGLWYLDSSDGFSARVSKHSQNIIIEFNSLLSDRILPSTTVSEVIVLALGALWKLRMIRDPKIRVNRKVIEPLMTFHILDLSRTLLVIGGVQLAEKPEDVQDKDDLAQHITAVFRRILPAIRIMSKWLRSNLTYIETWLSAAATPPSLLTAIKEFWVVYAAFFTALGETFPLIRLPSLNSPLEEDVDMSGFSPIKRTMLNRSAPTENGLALGHDKVHPNEEYLMRISDLLRDVNEVVTFEKSPILLSNGRFMVTEAESIPDEPMDIIPSSDSLASIVESHPDPPRAIRDSDDDNATQTSRTEDDVIREAFDTALADDDEIIWSPPRLELSPQQKVIHPPHSSPQAFTPVQLTSNLSPQRLPHLPGPSTSTTAQDLLNNVLGVSRMNSDTTPFAHASSTPQASLLFGSGSLNAPTKSIWSSTEGGLSMVGTARHAPSQHLSLAPGHGRSQSLTQQWVSSPPSAKQNLHYAGPGSPSAAFPLFRKLGQEQMMQQTTPLSSPHSSQTAPQIVYDSQFSRMPEYMPDPRPRVYPEQLEMPFTLYDSHATGLNAVGPFQRTVWDT